MTLFLLFKEPEMLANVCMHLMHEMSLYGISCSNAVPSATVDTICSCVEY